MHKSNEISKCGGQRNLLCHFFLVCPLKILIFAVAGKIIADHLPLHMGKDVFIFCFSLQIPRSAAPIFHLFYSLLSRQFLVYIWEFV